MTRDDSSLTPSRRSVLRFGLAISSGAFASSSANATDSADAETATERRRSIARATVFPYQWTPGARFEIVEADVDWQPARVRRAGDQLGGGESRTHAQINVIRYDFSSSYRAFLFTDGEAAVRPERRYRFDDSSARATDGAGLIDVDVTPLERRS